MHEKREMSRRGHRFKVAAIAFAAGLISLSAAAGENHAVANPTLGERGDTFLTQQVLHLPPTHSYPVLVAPAGLLHNGGKLEKHNGLRSELGGRRLGSAARASNTHSVC